MVSIEVVTEPPGAEVTWGGEIKGISPIVIEVELPKTIDDFRGECIGKCGRVGKHIYLPVCVWEILKGWLESGIVGNSWWDLTDDQRWCVAYKTTSMESSDEISKYNLPLYEVTIEPSATSINAIQIKENITNIDGWLFFSPGEPDITPGESDIIPIGSIISIFDGVGDKIVEFDLSYQWLPIFRDECLRDGEVVCSWDVLKARLEDQTVSRLWWDLTKNERYSIAHMATSNILNFQVRYIKRDEGCGFGANESKGQCTANAIIRFSKFDHIMGCMSESGLCFWKKDDTDTWHNYLDAVCYNIPCFIVAALEKGVWHEMTAIALNIEIKGLQDLFIFQFSEIDIQPGSTQLSHGGVLRVVYPGDIACEGGMYYTLITSIDVP